MALSYSLQNGDGVTKNFAVPFQYLLKSHVHAFVNDVETNAFTWLTDSMIQFTVAPSAGTSNVKLVRTTPRNEVLVDYQNGSNLFDTDLDTGVLQNLFLAQEFFEAEIVGVVVSTDHTIDSHLDSVPGASVVKGSLRIYDENSQFNAVDPPGDGDILIGDTADTKGARWLPKGTDGYQLEVNNAVAGKLQWVSTLKQLLSGVGDIVYASAANVLSRLAIGLAGQVLSVSAAGVPEWAYRGFTTGDVKLTWKTTADTGWIMADDGTIGDASSGASTRANADCQALFLLLWNNFNNTDAPVVTGRGASAAADWSAHKKITLPKTLTRTLVVSGAGSGLTSRRLGEAFGSNTAVNVTHNHGITDPGHAHNEGFSSEDGAGSSGTNLANVALAANDISGTVTVRTVVRSNTTGISINNSGVSGADQNNPASTTINVMVKL